MNERDRSTEEDTARRESHALRFVVFTGALLAGSLVSYELANGSADCVDRTETLLFNLNPLECARDLNLMSYNPDTQAE